MLSSGGDVRATSFEMSPVVLVVALLEAAALPKRPDMVAVAGFGRDADGIRTRSAGHLKSRTELLEQAAYVRHLDHNQMREQPKAAFAERVESRDENSKHAKDDARLWR